MLIECGTLSGSCLESLATYLCHRIADVVAARHFYTTSSLSIGRGIQVHAKSADETNLAAFLVGAGHRAYFGIGGWSSASAAANSFGHWDPIFGKPLGAPHADAMLSADGVYSRQFGPTNISVTFDTNTNHGKISGWGSFPPSPPPSPAPPTPPAPPV